MLILASLLVALASLVVGLVLSSSAWFAVSIVASLLAAALLSRSRLMLRRGAVREGRQGGMSLHSGMATHGVQDGDVWVVLGRGRYHRRECTMVADQHAEAVPHAQARHDGLLACSLCQPDAVTGHAPPS